MHVLNHNDPRYQTLRKILDQWCAAIVTNEVTKIAPFISDDWILVTPEVGIVRREDFLEAVESGRLTHDTMSHEILRVAVDGDMALVTTHGKNTGSFLGDPLNADEWTTDVFVRDGDQWKCVLTQLTPLTKPRTESSHDGLPG